MQALSKKHPEKGAWIETKEIPTPAPDEVLIKVSASSICGSDLHIYDWDEWASSSFTPPLTFGHEFCGTIVKVGDKVTTHEQGDFVSGESHIPCLECTECRSDKMHICEKGEILGFSRNGCFAEYVTLPSICAWKHPTQLSPDLGTLFEPLGNAVHCVQLAEVKNKTCAVFGCGPAGLFTVMTAKAMGAKRVIVVEIDKFRLELAKQVGADDVLGSEDTTYLKGIDISFEMSGSPNAIRYGLAALRNGGTFIAFGIPRQKFVQIDWSSDFIIKGRRLIGVVGRHMFTTWKLAQELVNTKAINPTAVITHRFNLSEFQKAFETRHNNGKIVLYPGK